MWSAAEQEDESALAEHRLATREVGGALGGEREPALVRDRTRDLAHDREPPRSVPRLVLQPDLTPMVTRCCLRPESVPLRGPVTISRLELEQKPQRRWICWA
jgi:hypothetical protein